MKIIKTDDLYSLWVNEKELDISIIFHEYHVVDETEVKLYLNDLFIGGTYNKESTKAFLDCMESLNNE